MPENHSRDDTVDHAAKIIKAQPDIAYGDLVKAAKKDGYHVYPLIAGLAKNKLGMGRPNKRGPGRPRGPDRPAGSGRGPGRPAISARRGRPPKGGNGLTGDLVRGLTRMQNDVAEMRSALRDIGRLAARF